MNFQTQLNISESHLFRIQSINFTKTAIIGKSAFQWCSKLTGPLNFPDTLEFIGEYSFCKCSELSKKITFNFKKITIGKSAFEFCSNLKSSVFVFNNVDDNGQNDLSINLNIDIDAFKSVKIANFTYHGKNQKKLH